MESNNMCGIEPETTIDVDYINLEQWKTACTLVAEESKKRMSMNQCYISVLTVLLGSVLFSNTLSTIHPLSSHVIISTICVVGVFICNSWKSQLHYYQLIIGEKYSIIRNIEQDLPQKVLCEEYKNFYLDSNNKDVAFSDHERKLPITFEVAFILCGITMIITNLII